jgi:zinc protease
MVADAKAVKLEDIKAFYKEFYGASYGDVVVVGDFDPAQVEALAKELFGSWKSPTPYVRMTQGYEKIAPETKVFETPDKANAMFLAGSRYRMSDEDADYPAITLANFIFGGSASSRLMDRLRQKDGFSYGVQSQMTAGMRDDDGTFMTFAILAPQNIEKLEAAFKEEVEKILKEGFLPAEVESAKKAWLQQRAVQRSQDAGLVGVLASNEFHGRTMAFHANVEKKVEQMQLHELNTAVKKILTVEGLSIIKAGDFKKAGITK